MRLRMLYPAALGLALLLTPGQASADLNFQASLSSAQEVPVNGSTATGSGQFVLNAAETNLAINVTFSGLSAAQTAAHIHGAAPPGVNAGVVFGFPLGSPVIQNWAIPAAHVLNLKAGLLYVNVHTTAFPGGEIRGQILAAVPVVPNSWGRVKAMYSSGAP